MVCDYNNFTASIGEYNAEKDEAAATNEKKKKKKEAEKEAKKVSKEASEKEMRDNLLPGMEDDMRKCLEHVMGCKNGRLREFVRYYFQLKVSNLFKKNLS